ncbi:MAG: MlaD family protein [Chromatiaceae bacterium]|nr:MlaD family protein [Chromatiaceae bacterium]
MSESIDRDSLPRATLTPAKRSRISAVWLIPLIAAILAVGIAVQRILNQGPTISIVFKSAEGVEAGKTIIKYKDVKIGQVTAVELHDNYSKVLVTAQIDKHAEGLMVEDAKFWVVHPRVTLSGVSGLSTLLSGNFIGFEKGTSKKTQHRFTGLETAPVIAIDQPGRQFLLTADDLGSLGTGSPIYFRRLNVGQVMAYDLAENGKDVTIQVFVNAPYDQFVTRGTRFWNASGLDVSLGASGVDVRTQSLVSLLIGGIAFETPSFDSTDEPAAADTAFALYDDRATAMKQPESIARHYIAYFNESMRGLSVGAPVTLLGLAAGEVTDVGFDLDPKTLKLRGRVEIVTYPERLVEHLSADETAAGEDIARSVQQSRALFQRLIEERGLRAQLRSGSLITGQRYVAFDFFPDAAEAEIDWSLEKPVVATVPSTLPDLEAKVTGILAKLDKIPFEAIGTDLRKTIETLDKTIEHINLGVTPGLKSAIAGLRRVLATANRVLRNTDATLLGKDAPGQLELRDALQEVARAARAVRVLSDYLERNPGALIRGKSGENP